MKRKRRTKAQIEADNIRQSREEIVDSVKSRRGKQIDFTELKEGTINHRGRKIVVCRKCGKTGERSSVIPSMIIHRGTEKNSRYHSLMPKLIPEGKVRFTPTEYCMEEDNSLYGK